MIRERLARASLLASGAHLFGWAATLLTGVAVVLLGVPSPAQNPNGFIQSDQWACLVPLFGNDCTGGGYETMRENWVAPHSVGGDENPVVGTVWSDIDFGGAAKSLGWRGGGAPTFVSIPPGANPDIVDYNEYLFLNSLTEDFVMGIAVTYVENNTGVPLTVGVCTGTDDSGQVWINNSLVFELVVCRGVGADCSEITPAVLAPGVNRIAVLVWEGHGGFGFRLGLTKPDGTKYTQKDTEITYLGASTDPGPVGQPLLTRSYPGSDILRPNASHKVTLKGDGRFATGTKYHVCEEFRRVSDAASNEASLLEITGVSDGGTVTDVDGTPPPTAGDFFRSVIGSPCSTDNDTLFDGVLEKYTTHATTGQDIWTGGDTFEYAFLHVEGEFDFALEILDRRFPPTPTPDAGTNRWGKFGLMARQSLDTDSKFTFLHDSGPEGVGIVDPVRLLRRPRHHALWYMDEQPGGGFNGVDPNDGTSLVHPKYLRLTRRGDTIDGWASNTANDGGRDPKQDANWVLVATDDWTESPSRLYLGFAYSVHNTSGCNPGEIDWRVVTREVDELPLPPAARRICWDVQGSVLDGTGLSYQVTAPFGEVFGVWGEGGPAKTQGPHLVTFQPAPTGPVGLFEDSHDIGRTGPCTPGSLTLDGKGTPDTSDDVYTLTGSGLDIWATGDQFYFAYKKVRGDFEIQARIRDVVHPPANGRWGKFGLMARWDAQPNSAYFFTHSAGATNFSCEIDGPRTAFRPFSRYDWNNGEPNAIWWQDVMGEEPMDGACTPIDPNYRTSVDFRGDERNLPAYLRMVRRGNMFYGYASDDGTDWRVLGGSSWVDAPDELLVGVGATSHALCDVIQISFEDLRIGPAPILEPPPGQRPADPDDAGTLLYSTGFDDDVEKKCPEGWLCNRWGVLSGFKPQIVKAGEDPRLRMANIRKSTGGRGEDNGTSAFLSEPIDPTKAYRFDFDLFFSYSQAVTLPEENAPADGLTFCILGTSTGSDLLNIRQGDRGAGLGFHRINVSLDESQLRSKGISLNSVAVEFDTWHSGEWWNDGDGGNVSGWNPSGGAAGTGTGAYHIGLDSNASAWSAQRNNHVGVHDHDLPDIFDPGGIHVRILYDHGHVAAFVDQNAAPGGKLTRVIDSYVEPVELNAQEALVGFTTATGGATCVMEVDNFEMRELPREEDGTPFRRGDANADGTLNITDGIYTLNYLFIGGPAPPCNEAADADDKGSINITDGIYTLNYLFLGGPAPPAPGPKDCGGDPDTTPSLGCELYTKC